jgi:hypothetical protein
MHCTCLIILSALLILASGCQLSDVGDPGEGRYTFANQGTMRDGNEDTPRHPVSNINWRDAMIWTNALTERYTAENGTNYSCAYYFDVHRQ